MNKFITQFNLKPGDEIIVPKSKLNIAQHHGICLGEDHYGVFWMVENNVGEGVRAITADDFFSSVVKINGINRFTGTNAEREALVKKALRSVGKPYDLINYNCQHFASELLTGKAESWQLKDALVLGIGALLLGALLSD